MCSPNRSTRSFHVKAICNPVVQSSGKHYRTNISAASQPTTATPNALKIQERIASDHAPIDKDRRGRHRLTGHQITALEDLYKEKTHPNKRDKKVIADELRLDERTVTIWFQNKRQNVKRGEDRAAAQHHRLLPRTALFPDSATSPKYTYTPHNPNPNLSDTLSPQNSTASRAPNIATRSLQTCPYRAPLAVVPHDDNATSLKQLKTHILVPSQEHCGLENFPLRADKGKTPASAPVLPHELWKHLLSSPPASPDNSPPGSPRFHEVRSGKRMLDWACERQTRRWHASGREHSGETTEDDNENENYTDGNTSYNPSQPAGRNRGRSGASGLALLCLAATYQNNMPEDIDQDVIYGAAMLLGLKCTTGTGC